MYTNYGQSISGDEVFASKQEVQSLSLQQSRENQTDVEATCHPVAWVVETEAYGRIGG